MMIRIGAWNLENLFRPGAESGPRDDAEYDAKLDALAAGVEALSPDVLAVQEVGDPDGREDLLDRVPGEWHAELADPDGRGIRVGVISRIAFDGAEQFADFPELLGGVRVSDDGDTIAAMGRPALRVTVPSGGREIAVVSAHLKSKLLTFPGGRFDPVDEGERARYAVYALHRRAAEAATLRADADAVLDGRGADVAYVIAADLNDEPQAATTQILHGPGGSEIDTAGFERPDQGYGDRLWNLAPLIPEDERDIRRYRGRRELIDHLLVSHVLAHAAVEVTTGSGEVPSVTDDPTRRRGEPGSDHRPVVADFEL